MADDRSTAAVRVHSHSKCRRRFRRDRSRKIKEVAVDSISSLPDVILQQILTFIPTKFTIRTSLLSKRWRHVWCDTPCLSFDICTVKAASVNKTLALYTAPKIMNFHLCTSMEHNVTDIEKWIEFSMSRNVENLSLEFWLDNCTFPDSFYNNYSVKELTITSYFADMVPTPRCHVSWTSLKKLSFHKCCLSDESMAKILSGCPVLEILTLSFCYELGVLDLSKSLRLRTLEIYRNSWVTGPTQIVAPHIHCLTLTTNSPLPCTLVDVSSLTDAKLNVCFSCVETNLDLDFDQNIALKMLEKLQNVENLTFGGNFLQILSLVELRGIPFPMLKVKALTLETAIFQYVIPGIERILLNSPDLKKLTIHTSHYNTIPEDCLDDYLALQGLNPAKCWRSKDGVFWNKSRWGRA